MGMSAEGSVHVKKLGEDLVDTKDLPRVGLFQAALGLELQLPSIIPFIIPLIMPLIMP